MNTQNPAPRTDLVLVAHDAAPSRCFVRLQEKLNDQGVRTVTLAGDGKPITPGSAVALLERARPRAVLVGMSSSKDFAAAELEALAYAREDGIPYGFYGDCRGAWARAVPPAWFAEFAADASLYLAIHQDELADAQRVFPKARCIVAGNPLREDAAFMQVDRAGVRQKLGVREDQILVLAPGGKNVAANCTIWGETLSALRLLSERPRHPRDIVMVITLHPGDRSPYMIDSVTGQRADPYQAVLDPVHTRYVTQETGLSTNEVLGAADIVIEFGVSSSIAAITRRIPVLVPRVGIMTDEFYLTTGDIWPEHLRAGASSLVELDCRLIASEIEHLTEPQMSVVKETLRRAQERAYPLPRKQGEALERIVTALKEVFLS